MKKSTKGALAAGSAAVLLMGGVGTLAYWSDSEDITGGAINSGDLTLSQESGQDCSNWTLDSAGGSTTYVPGTTLVVPGDVITRTCEYTVNASGSHLAATLGLEASAITGDVDLSGALDVDATYTLNAASVADGATVTSANDGHALVAAISVTFDTATSGTTAQLETAALNDVTISLTQTHA